MIALIRQTEKSAGGIAFQTILVMQTFIMALI